MNEASEKPRRRSREIGKRDWMSPQLSLSALLLFVTACGVTFGLMRAFGSYGLSVGVLLLFAAVGRVRNKANWQLAGLTGAFIIVLTIAISWHQFGSVDKIDHRAKTKAHLGFVQIGTWLDAYRDQIGHYPASKKQLITNQSIPDAAPDHMRFTCEGFAYQANGDAYELIFLGRDAKPGGVGIHADCTAETLSEYAASRVPLQQFLFDPYRANRIQFLSIFGLIAGLSSCQIIANSGSEFCMTKGKVLAYITTVAVAVGLGCLMASFHIAIGQSNH